MNRALIAVSLLLGLSIVACGASPDAATTAGTTPESIPPSDAGPAPSYGELFATYFAPGTPGHCATMGCHADPGHNVWRCGPTKDECYEGMLEVGLIDPARPSRSMIADAHRSPLTWINPDGGNMPLDAQLENAAGRDAIIAWVAAGARND
ncbi:MAG TPA: hypothetical protein VFK05_34115 [Polyangiaceae bacterium]|nr:hypothetical protein [Polyangiaceae bacterium]